jgi:hypothetical protein
MICRSSGIFLLLTAVVSCLGAWASSPTDKLGDPLQQITKTFPDSIKLKNKGKLLEFCPDNTCHGFVASGDVSVTTLKDFAYLYVYFFSDYYALPEWRGRDEAKQAADGVLSKPEYHRCDKGASRESARCVLLTLSHNGKIKLLFIRYDEGQRNVVHESIAEQLSEKKTAPKQ